MRQVSAWAGDKPSLRSLTAFLLARAAGHTEELSLEFFGDPEEPQPEEVPDGISAAAEMAAAVVACAAARPLSRLLVRLADTPFSAGSWLLPLRGSLRRLHLEVITDDDRETLVWSELATPLQGFTTLEALFIDTGAWGYLTADSHVALAHLPRSLTALCVAQLPDARTSNAVVQQVPEAGLHHSQLAFLRQMPAFHTHPSCQPPPPNCCAGALAHAPAQLEPVPLPVPGGRLQSLGARLPPHLPGRGVFS